jgi:hypothetical protein
VKSKKSLVLSSILVIAMTFLLGGCAVLDNAAKMQEYDFGSDKIPTVNSYVGERAVSSVSTTTDNGNVIQEYTYSSDSVFKDLLDYTLYLRDNGWLVVEEYNLSNAPGTAKIAKDSADEGQILIMTISYANAKYTIEIVKGKGTLDKRQAEA